MVVAVKVLRNEYAMYIGDVPLKKILNLTNYNTILGDEPKNSFIHSITFYLTI